LSGTSGRNVGNLEEPRERISKKTEKKKKHVQVFPGGLDLATEGLLWLRAQGSEFGVQGSEFGLRVSDPWFRVWASEFMPRVSGLGFRV